MNSALALSDFVGLPNMIYFVGKNAYVALLLTVLTNRSLALLDGDVMPMVNYFDEKKLLYTVTVLSNGALALLDGDVMPNKVYFGEKMLIDVLIDFLNDSLALLDVVVMPINVGLLYYALTRVPSCQCVLV